MELDDPPKVVYGFEGLCGEVVKEYANE